ncbi:ankyrin repeat domain-containing protein [Corallococcus sp. CA054B]|uniref:ankyrin repeat domain-containing protein n=1 Tax=Corallococcus sp. CA054B TaxID=2316734 RepID=UPI0013155B4C|nr:ankyrin repeat domain-containing protein [Corallococcus sp. CA054B]
MSPCSARRATFLSVLLGLLMCGRTAQATSPRPHTPPVMRAILDDDAVALRALLAKGASINSTDEMIHPRVHSPLMVACEEGKEKAANVLLDAGADPLLIVPRHQRYWPPPGWSAVCFARFKGLKRIEKRLVDAGASARTACLLDADFLAAAVARKPPLVERLARQGRGAISPSVIQYAMGQALAHKDVALMRAVLVAGGPDPSREGAALLHRWLSDFDAVSPAMVDALLEGGVRPPLQPLAQAGLSAQVARALEMGASPRTQSGELNSSLQLAVRKGHAEVVRLLLKAGADPNGPGFGSPVLLLEAARRLREDKGDPTMMKLLLEAGARVDARLYNSSPLNLAADGCSAEVVSLLLGKMSREAIAEEPGTYLYAQALRSGDFCTEAKAVQVLQALVAGGVRVREQRGMHGDILVTRARESRAIKTELLKAGLQLPETP